MSSDSMSNDCWSTGELFVRCAENFWILIAGLIIVTLVMMADLTFVGSDASMASVREETERC